MTIVILLVWLAIGFLIFSLIERQDPGTLNAGFRPDNGPLFRALVMLIAALLWPVLFLIR